MMRYAGVLVLFGSIVTGAAAQTPAPAAAGNHPAPGSYSGSLQEWGGRGTADVKLEIRNVTKDGRVTARAQSSGVRRSCAKSLPASGIMLPDGGMRLEVDAGAPDGCERIYNVKAEGGTLSGTYVDAVRAASRQSGKK